jgi:hypothetical protein
LSFTSQPNITNGMALWKNINKKKARTLTQSMKNLRSFIFYQFIRSARVNVTGWKIFPDFVVT